MEKKIDQLLGIIHEIVDDTGVPWREKAANIKARASADEMTSLMEFTSWFGEDE